MAGETLPTPATGGGEFLDAFLFQALAEFGLAARHGWGTGSSRSLFARFLMCPAKIVGGAQQMHASVQRLATMSRMAALAR